jgi:peptidyl-prolyl cis-trans isomerase D
MIRFLQTPGPIKKIILSGILIFISVAMVYSLGVGGMLNDIWGTNPNQQGVLASVGDELVTVSDVDVQARSMARQQFPRGIPSALMPFLRQQAAQSLITQKAMDLEAKQMGLRVSDEELADEICHGVFSTDLCPKGVPVSHDQYQNWVASRFPDWSIPQFEQEYKESLLIGKLQAMITGGVNVSDAEMRQEFDRRQVKVKLEYAVLNAEDVAKQVKLTDAELAAYYTQNKARYANAIPEKRQVRYLLADLNKLREQTTVTEADLERYYDAHRDQFRVADRVNVRQIEIKLPEPGPDGKLDPKAVEAARAKAEDVLRQLKAGGDFAALAKKYSEDPSKDNGGSMGWLDRGRTTAEFDQVAFSLAKGQTSDVVRDALGFHIFRLDDKQSAHVQNLDEVKAEIEPQVKDEKASRAADTLITALQNELRTMSLEQAGAKHGLQVMTSEYFSRTDTLPGIGASPDFADAVFSSAENSPPQMARVPSGFVFFRLTGVKAAAAPSFDQIRARVEADFRQERASMLLAQKTQELSDRAKAAHDLKKAAKELGATLKTSELVGPDGQVPDIGALTGPASVVFSMKPGQITGPIEGDRAGIVISVLELQQPSDADFVVQKDQVRDALLQSKRNQMMNLYATDLVQRLEKEGKIRKNQQEWDRLINVRENLGG